MMTTTSFCCRQPLRAAAALSRAAPGRNAAPKEPNKSRRAVQTPERIAARHWENKLRRRAPEGFHNAQTLEGFHNAQALEGSHNVQASGQPRSGVHPPEQPRDLRAAEITRDGQTAEAPRIKPASGAYSGRKASEAPQERKTVERQRAIVAERICLAVLGTALCAVSAYNFFQPNRPTVSESENRTLTPMPTYSAQALRSGEYFFAARTAFFGYLCRQRTVDVGIAQDRHTDRTERRAVGARCARHDRRITLAGRRAASRGSGQTRGKALERRQGRIFQAPCRAARSYNRVAVRRAISHCM